MPLTLAEADRGPIPRAAAARRILDILHAVEFDVPAAHLGVFAPWPRPPRPCRQRDFRAHHHGDDSLVRADIQHEGRAAGHGPSAGRIRADVPVPAPYQKLPPPSCRPGSTLNWLPKSLVTTRSRKRDVPDAVLDCAKGVGDRVDDRRRRGGGRPKGALRDRERWPEHRRSRPGITTMRRERVRRRLFLSGCL